MAAATVVETVAENVADELELAAVATRRIDARILSSTFIGCGVGFAVGFYVGYQYSKRKLRNEIYAEAEEDIETIRTHYQQRILAAENQDKPAIQDLLQEKGYVTAEEAAEVRPLRPPVPVDPPEPVKLAPEMGTNPVSPVESTRRTTNVFPTSEATKDKDDKWDYEIELTTRVGKEIYIIHQDEFHLNESGYAQVTYGYYAVDNILVDEADPHNMLNNRDELIGTEALKLFGHGSDNYNTVYIRNDELELEIEVNNIPKSWEVEVLGLDPNESG